MTLSREQAQSRLADFAIKDPRYPVAIGFGKHLRITKDLIKLHQGDRSLDHAELAKQLDALDDKARTKLFGGFSTALARPLNVMWGSTKSAHYQTGWTRRAFRTNDPRLSAERRLLALRLTLDIGLQYNRDATWVAQWVGRGLTYNRDLAPLLASEVATGNYIVRMTLRNSMVGQDEIGLPSHEAVMALLSSRDREDWEFVGTLLVNAQRQEGLRQVILESADFGHPHAFAHLLQVIRDERLTRFAATVRAASTWFGDTLDVRQEKKLVAVLDRVLSLLESGNDTVTPGDAGDTYLQLWCLAFRDVEGAVSEAVPLLRSPDPDVRFAATRILAETQLDQAFELLTPVLNDPDQRVSATAILHYDLQTFGPSTTTVPLSEQQARGMLSALESAPRRRSIQLGVVGDNEVKFGATDIADRIVQHAPAVLRDLIEPAYAKAGVNGRRIRVRMLATNPKTNRAELFAMLGDASSEIRAAVAESLLKSVKQITADEASSLAQLLTRTASDLRRYCMELIRRQDEASLARSVNELAGGTDRQRAAAREISGVHPVQSAASEPLTTSSGPGLRALPTLLVVDHGERTPVQRPEPLPVPKGQHQRCQVLCTSLVAWLDEHRDVEVVDPFGVKRLLGNIGGWFGTAGVTQQFPLEEVLRPWWERIEPALTDGGLECALVTDYGSLLQWNEKHVRALRNSAASIIGTGSLPQSRQHTQSQLAMGLIRTIAHLQMNAAWVDPLIDAHSTFLAGLVVGDEERKSARQLDVVDHTRSFWSSQGAIDRRAGVPSYITVYNLLLKNQLTKDQVSRIWALLRYVDEPQGRHVPGVDAMRPSPRLASRLGVDPSHPDAQIPDQPLRIPPQPALFGPIAEMGVATDADVIDALTLLPEQKLRSHHPTFAIGARRAKTDSEAMPRYAMLERQVEETALSYEVHRGEFDTRVSHIVERMSSAEGIQTFVSYVSALGKGRLVRGYIWGGAGRDGALSRVIRLTRPAPSDNADQLAQVLSAAGVSQKRLIEVGVYSPQWARLLEPALGWEGYEEGVWWLHAHTKSEDWTVDKDLRDEWAAEISRRTPLDAEDLLRGAVDVDWFNHTIDLLGRERFDVLLKAAKFASSSGGHKRAELFARTLLGEVTEAELQDRIASKRHQDSVRSLGLIPLSSGSSDRDDIVLHRYEFLRSFVASDRTSGSQRRASEKAAADVGIDNLARTAGYSDPQRLVWAMEAHAVRDLSAGPLTATDGDVSVSLSIDETGSAVLAVDRAGKSLKSVPKQQAANPEIAALKSRVSTLRAQRKRMIESLENACVTGETFTPDEYAELLQHPMLRPLLQRLVVVTSEDVIGFATESPDALVDADDARIATDGSLLRIAHPLDLLTSGRWPDFQHHLFQSETKQPFKQVFRELYTPTQAELEDVTVSRRYSGHQVESGRAGGLFKARGWVADFEVGFIKTFHREKVTAWCALVGMFGTPGEVEDGTIHDLHFVSTSKPDYLRIDEVPPRLFSEVMRDLDLVVSVAHASGVDPETSESSVEMRARLVDETADMLSLRNVELTDHHAIVRGALATYSVNLGSGVVHRQPGASVCIVPISAQHRGRIFLPFMDDDPRTAEIISKVVLLARDDKIQDPTILEQLR